MKQEQDTKTRVLEAACELFSQQGYRDTTVQHICGSAEANVAAVNYYFGSKAELYRAVWQERFGFISAMITELGSRDEEPMKTLEMYIRKRVEYLFAGGVSCQMPMIVHREMANPSEIHDELRDRYLRPNIRFLVGLTARILDVDESDLLARHAAFSIHGQLVSLAMARRFDGPMSLLFDSRPPPEDEVEQLVEHLTRFARGGLRGLAGKAGGR